MSVYKKSSFFFFFKQNDNHTREDRLFNTKVLYTNTNFGQKFINHPGSVNFNSLPIGIKIIYNQCKYYK